MRFRAMLGLAPPQFFPPEPMEKIGDATELGQLDTRLSIRSKSRRFAFQKLPTHLHEAR